MGNSRIQVTALSKEFESLMEGLKEDLQDMDIGTNGEPQERKTIIEKHRGSENLGKQEAGMLSYIQDKTSLGYCAKIADMSKEDFIRYLGSNGISIFQFDDEREFVEEMNNA